MKQTRQIYYDLFSKIYDYFVLLHSSDKSQKLRRWFIHKAEIKPGMKILDLCTGTGSVALMLKKILEKNLVIGMDFSEGMLRKAMSKSCNYLNLYWIKGNATELPFKDKSFDIVLCSYAFYELKNKDKLKAMIEIKRVIKDGGKFCMMEHEEPSKPLLKLLYRIRIASMGSLDSVKFLKNELNLIHSFFGNVTKYVSPSGNSKIIIAIKKMEVKIDECICL